MNSRAYPTLFFYTMSIMKNPTPLSFKAILVALVFSTAIFAQIDTAFQRGVDLAGCASLRAKKYRQALDEITLDTAAHDLGFHLFKVGLAQEGMARWDEALTAYRGVAACNTILAPLSYEKIGDVECGRGRLQNALTAYRTAADSFPQQRYQYHVWNKMALLASQHRDSIGTMPWLEEIIKPAAAPEPVDTVPAFIEGLVDSGMWRVLDSVVSAAIGPNVSDTCCSIGTLLDPATIPDTVFSTPLVFRLAQQAGVCKKNLVAGEWLQRASDRKNFAKSIDQQEYLAFRAELNFRLKNFNKAISWAKLYEAKYAPTQPLVYIVARAYRALGNDSIADVWYLRHLKLFPTHLKSIDIIWYRAWQKEDAGDIAAARQLYRQIFERYPRNKRAEEALFRYALCFFKEENWEQAGKAFNRSIQKYSQSTSSSAAHFWKAKCLLAQHARSDAQALFRTISQNDPTGYYGYRSREMVVILGDTALPVLIDTGSDMTQTVRWLDSLSDPQRLAIDSVALRRGILLASLGLMDHADIFLEPFEFMYQNNLVLQFTLASMYAAWGDPALSFRVARQLYLRIPQPLRRIMPFPLYPLMYPDAFGESIRMNASQFNVSALLISAIIRQESQFDPQALSPVGAVGLMQIMPYTGVEIAHDLRENFQKDSLGSIATNIRYGSYYIHKVLSQFKGNLPLAIASYNGGPHNAQRWLEINRSDDLDLFVEDIGFAETREYVKKVLANYWTYQLLSTRQAYYRSKPVSTD
jgi:tetratricopeptide (TPR) repeat protein